MTFEQLKKIVSAKKAGVRIDSRRVCRGDVFVAISGSEMDGHEFVGSAIDAGAVYVVVERDCGAGEKQVLVDDSRYAAAVLAQAFFGDPAEKLTSLAVTGTNGKTTVAFLVRAILRAASKRCGLIGTIEYDTGERRIDAERTTPDCVCIAEMMAEMVESGCEYMVAETSSHALDQGRVCGVDFQAAAFTNLTGDHLDYHKTEDEYLRAKGVLFENLSTSATAVLNGDDCHSESLAEITKAGLLWYGIENEGGLSGSVISMSIDGIEFELVYGSKRAKVKTPLVGRYNVSNCLAAAGLCLSVELDFESVAAGLSNSVSIPGRLERVGVDRGFTVLIDYAHTDDALQNVLSTLKPLCRGRLIVVFGCGGDRDTSKRARMAHVAEKLADVVVVTSDNPRSEEPEYIIGEIMTGFDDPVAESIVVTVEREDGIRAAVEMAREGDVILIAGKGHEQYQVIGDEVRHFSDREVAEKYLERLSR